MSQLPIPRTVSKGQAANRSALKELTYQCVRERRQTSVHSPNPTFLLCLPEAGHRKNPHPRCPYSQGVRYGFTSSNQKNPCAPSHKLAVNLTAISLQIICPFFLAVLRSICFCDFSGKYLDVGFFYKHSLLGIHWISRICPLPQSLFFSGIQIRNVLPFCWEVLPYFKCTVFYYKIQHKAR